MKHIGILAHSFEGATLCFRTACLEGVKRLGSHMHPEITMTCSPMALVLDAWERGDNQALRAVLHGGCRRSWRQRAATFSFVPTIRRISRWNSPGEPFPIPALHIGEVVAEQAT